MTYFLKCIFKNTGDEFLSHALVEAGHGIHGCKKAKFLNQQKDNRDSWGL